MSSIRSSFERRTSRDRRPDPRGLQEQLRSSIDALARRALGGAVVVLEIVTGLLLAVVVLFFLLKDGERIWEWLVSLVTPARRDDVREIGERAWHALAGFVRGQTLVALFDAVLIGSAIAIIGAPLALPLAVEAGRERLALVEVGVSAAIVTRRRARRQKGRIRGPGTVRDSSSVV